MTCGGGCCLQQNVPQISPSSGDHALVAHCADVSWKYPLFGEDGAQAGWATPPERVFQRFNGRSDGSLRQLPPLALATDEVYRFREAGIAHHQRQAATEQRSWIRSIAIARSASGYVRRPLGMVGTAKPQTVSTSFGTSPSRIVTSFSTTLADFC